MTSAAYSVHPALAITADVFLPVFGALTILLPALAACRGKVSPPVRLWVCGIVSIALLYLVRWVNYRTGTWASFGLHFSSHTAVAVSFGVTLIAFRLWLLPLVTVLVAGYLWLITYLPYHTHGDVLTTTAVILPLSLLCHIPWWRRASGHA